MGLEIVFGCSHLSRHGPESILDRSKSHICLCTIIVPFSKDPVIRNPAWFPESFLARVPIVIKMFHAILYNKRESVYYWAGCIKLLIIFLITIL
jgi:hypothetical protein